MTVEARTAVPYTKVKATGQAEGGYRLREQIEALIGWPEAEGYKVLVWPLGVERYGSGRSADDA
jgi:hypothetical protein